MPASRVQHQKSFVQGTLPFGSSKRVLTTQNNKKSSLQTKKLTVARKTSSSSSSSGESIEAFSSRVPSSEEESIEDELTKKQRLTPPITQKPKSQAPATIVPQSKTSAEGQVISSLPELDGQDPKWRKPHNDAMQKKGRLAVRTIHAQGQNKIHEILRIFDMSYEYGPCIGVSRLERWQRAEALGLNPPVEVREILMTRQGTEQREYAQSVLFDNV